MTPDPTPPRRTARSTLKTTCCGALLALLAAFALPEGPLTFRSLDLHPDRLFRPYVAGPLLADSASLSVKTIQAFRDLIDQYHVRQGRDDNFTIRVTDNRSDRLLELYTLEEERARFERLGETDWSEIDRLRRTHTRRLVDKWAARGIPRRAISAKWGRADQVREAREADLPFLMYEVRLARYLDLSLLATEIGTVETFNNDRLVSSVGARGRYQMMPYLLEQHGLRSYNLPTAAGNTVPVVEVWHPLLTMEPAFITLRGYVNAVGHEIPGLSAYHAGPGNVFRIYRKYMEHAGTFSPASTVADAYVWGITDGFDIVSSGSSFGNYSRTYVPAAYGSLRAVEELPIDTTATMLAERVLVEAGRDVFLSHLLRTLDAHRDRLHLHDPEADLYDVFRALNPHITLPGSDGGVPVRGDLKLTRTRGGGPVRIFLPLGATAALEAADVHVLDQDETFRFGPQTYRDRPVLTEADRAYAELVRDAGRFGFSAENRRRLAEIEAEFERLARSNPSHFRRMQLQIVEIHDRLWNSSPWDNLAAVTRARTRSFDAP